MSDVKICGKELTMITQGRVITTVISKRIVLLLLLILLVLPLHYSKKCLQIEYFVYVNIYFCILCWIKRSEHCIKIIPIDESYRFLRRHFHNTKLWRSKVVYDIQHPMSSLETSSLAIHRAVVYFIFFKMFLFFSFNHGGLL